LHDDIEQPKYALPGDGGIDCRSAEDYVLKVGEVHNIPLGMRVEMPEGFVGLILPKSGLGSKTGLDTLPGLIDNGYRGEIQMIARNISSKDIVIKRGQKVCQLMILELPRVTIKYDKVNENTKRGANGFGSTGI
jgi:dUTP pyrophosphatase